MDSTIVKEEEFKPNKIFDLEKVESVKDFQSAYRQLANKLLG